MIPCRDGEGGRQLIHFEAEVVDDVQGRRRRRLAVRNMLSIVRVAAVRDLRDRRRDTTQRRQVVVRRIRNVDLLAFGVDS